MSILVENIRSRPQPPGHVLGKITPPPPPLIVMLIFFRMKRLVNVS